MKFKLTTKSEDEKPTVSVKVQESGILLQSQVHGEAPPMHPPIFSLSWKIDYANGDAVKSDWTPGLLPSIEKTMAARHDAVKLTILGDNKIAGTQLELARIDWKLVQRFGYIAEQFFSNMKKQYIIGMWIEISGKRKINVYTNGLVMEVLT